MFLSRLKNGLSKMNIIYLLIFFSLIFFTILLKTFYSILPGDIVVEKFIQKNIYFNHLYAIKISALANFPNYLFLLLISITLTWILTKNFHAILLSIFSFIGILVIEKIIKSFVFVERPSSNLVNVVQKFSGSSFPSTSALIYGAVFGFLIILITHLPKTFFNLLIFAISIFILLLITFARIILGAHWPSDILFSYLIAYFWIITLFKFISL